MPVLKPQRPESRPALASPEAKEIMAEILSPGQCLGQPQTSPSAPRSRVTKALDTQGLSLEQLAVHMSQLLYTGEESTKLKVIDQALKMHGALEGEGDKQGPIVVNITLGRKYESSLPLSEGSIFIPREERGVETRP